MWQRILFVKLKGLCENEKQIINEIPNKLAWGYVERGYARRKW